MKRDFTLSISINITNMPDGALILDKTYLIDVVYENLSYITYYNHNKEDYYISTFIGLTKFF